MEFRIADTFTESLARLTGDEQKAVKTTAFDLQIDPAAPGMSFHRLAKSRDKRFWSVRVSQDIRLIVHRTAQSLLLCYVDHHDRAYAWAERRKLETHPATGAAQLPDAGRSPPGRGGRGAARAGHRRHAAEISAHHARGGSLRASRTDIDELARALEYPWERWIVFLHPAQRDLVERSFGGPARISGSAGTGKTVVALHRAAHLARKQPDARVLLTTFSEALASSLRVKLARLVGTEPRLRERIDVDSLDTVARRLHDRMLGRAEVASREVVGQLVREAARDDARLSPDFLVSEWSEVVDAWQLDSWEAYRDVARLGRKRRLPETQRRELWTVFDRVRAVLKERGVVTQAALYGRLAAHLSSQPPARRVHLLAGGGRSPYDFVVIDEAQDVSVAQLRFVAALAGGRPDALFFAGDLGQRIFQMPFSWRSLGVDIRGRSATLRINYRTSHQIRTQADRLLGKQITDVDGNTEDRRATISVFNGPEPTVRVASSAAEEPSLVGEWLRQRAAEGVAAGEMAVFVRSAAEMPRARAAVEAAGLHASALDDGMKMTHDRVPIGTMHLSKGLEFRAVAVMACDDEILPLQARIEAVTDEGDLEEVYDTERHLLYVACTRARDHLLVAGVAPASEFLDDLRR